MTQTGFEIGEGAGAAIEHRRAERPAFHAAPNIMTLLVWMNGVVFLFIVAAFIMDCTLITVGLIASSDRIIDAKVVISIVAAATVQMGVILLGFAPPRIGFGPAPTNSGRPPSADDQSYMRAAPENDDRITSHSAI